MCANVYINVQKCPPKEDSQWPAISVLAIYLLQDIYLQESAVQGYFPWVSSALPQVTTWTQALNILFLLCSAPSRAEGAA